MRILKVVFVIIGTLIGAGFASGQEIYTFFFSFGLKGLLGILISSLIIGGTIYKAFKIIIENNIDNYKEFLNQFIKNNKLKDILEEIINIFILISFYIMIAGFGAYLQQEYKLNNLEGSIILATLCYFLLKKDIKGIIKANEILIPILIAVLTFIGIINIKNIDIKNIYYYIEETNTKNWLITCILYASYNCVLLVPVLISIKEYIKKEKDIKYIAFIVTLIIFLLLIIVYLLLINIDVNINNLEIPVIYAVKIICPQIKNIYGGIILISIFTTAISLGISFARNTAKNNKQFNNIVLVICITSVVFSGIGFSNLVNILYPILGALGLIQIIKLYI